MAKDYKDLIVGLDIGTSKIVAIVADGDRTPLLRQIRQPTRVIHGADDPLVVTGHTGTATEARSGRPRAGSRGRAEARGRASPSGCRAATTSS